MAYDVRIVSPQELADDAALSDAIVAATQMVWPSDFPGNTLTNRRLLLLKHQHAATFAIGRPWTTRQLVVEEADRVIATAVVTTRQIGTELGDRRVLGLANVLSVPDRRGLGLGRIVVQRAFAMVSELSLDGALFQTSNAVMPFYQKLGAAEVTNPIHNGRHTTSDRGKPHRPFWDDRVMRYPADADWPQGPIDLNGPAY